MYDKGDTYKRNQGGLALTTTKKTEGKFNHDNIQELLDAIFSNTVNIKYNIA